MNLMCWFSHFLWAGFTINRSLYVHGKQLSHEHPLWEKLPHSFQSVSSICQLLNYLKEFHVCLGNPDEDLLSMYSEGVPTQEASRHDYLALAGDQQYCATVRHIQCASLIRGLRCKYCQKTLGCLWFKRARKFAQDKTSANSTIISPTCSGRVCLLARGLHWPLAHFCWWQQIYSASSGLIFLRIYEIFLKYKSQV